MELKEEILFRIKSLKGIKNIIKDNSESLPLIYDYLCEIEKNFTGIYYELIMIQKITVLIKLNRLNEALEICNLEIFKNNLTVITQKIVVLIELDRLSDALDICCDEKYKNNRLIQDLRIKALMKQNELFEALEICSNPTFLNDIVIQTKRINLLITLGRLEEALDYCDNPSISNSKVIVSHKITILIKLNKLDKALKLCEDERFSNHASVLSQRITILTMLNRIPEALKLCDGASYINNEIIQSQKINILLSLGKLEEALNICCRKEFENYNAIQSQRITILIKLNKLDSALKIASNPIFKDNFIIQNQKEYIISILDDMPQESIKEINESLVVKPNLENNLLDLIFTKIYNGSISLTEIDNSDLSDFEKLVLKALYYEKNRLPGFSKTIKKNMNKYAPNQVKILKEICTRLDRKSGYLDYLVYQEYLNCNLIESDNISNITLEKLYKDEILEIISYIYINPTPDNMKLLAEIDLLKDKTIEDSESVAKFIMLLRKCESNNIIKYDLESLENKIKSFKA